MMTRPLALVLKSIGLVLIWLCITVAAAPTSCSFSCPSVDENGHVLIVSPHSTPYEGPYSVFDCVYAIPGSPTLPHTCWYYKADGLNTLGMTQNNDCPTQAMRCTEDTMPNFSAPDKVERPPWMGPGADLLYYRENHPSPHPIEQRDMYYRP